MADTIVNTPPSQDSGAGWFVAIILLLVIAAGGFMVYRYRGVPTAAQPSVSNINVTIPNPATGDTGNAGANVDAGSGAGTTNTTNQ